MLKIYEGNDYSTGNVNYEYTNNDVNDINNLNDIYEDEVEDEKIEPFRLFDSSRYGSLSNLMFSDSVMSLKNIPLNEMSYTSYLGKFKRYLSICSNLTITSSHYNIYFYISFCNVQKKCMAQ